MHTLAVWSECLARFVVFDVKARAPLDSTPSIFDRQGRGNLLIRGSATCNVSSISSEKPHPRRFEISSTQHEEKHPCGAYYHPALQGFREGSLCDVCKCKSWVWMVGSAFCVKPPLKVLSPDALSSSAGQAPSSSFLNFHVLHEETDPSS